MYSLEFIKLWHKAYASELFALLCTQAAEENEDDGTMDPSHVADPTACKLGRWLGMMPDPVRLLPAFVRLKIAHDRFHCLAGEMVVALLAGNRAQAMRIRDGDMAKASGEIDEAIDALSAILSSRGASTVSANNHPKAPV